MKTIKNTGTETVTIKRFDNGADTSFTPNTEIEVDDATADFLLTQVYKQNGAVIAQFVQI